MFWIGGCGAMSQKGRAWTSVTESRVMVGSMMVSTRSGRGLLAWSRTFPWAWRFGLGNAWNW